MPAPEMKKYFSKITVDETFLYSLPAAFIVFFFCAG
jgi:hypothetical protein